MSYCTTPQAKSIVGVDLAQDLLDEAQAIIHNYTPHRWSETTVTDLTLSGDSKEVVDNNIHLNSPIISVDSLVVDDDTLVEGENEDYQVDYDNGIIYVWSGIPNIVNTIVITYKYGYTSSHRMYNDTIPIVRGAEARIALFLKRNPGFLGNLGVSGANVAFGNDHIMQYLIRVPKPLEFVAI